MLKLVRAPEALLCGLSTPISWFESATQSTSFESTSSLRGGGPVVINRERFGKYRAERRIEVALIKFGIDAVRDSTNQRQVDVLWPVCGDTGTLAWTRAIASMQSGRIGSS